MDKVLYFKILLGGNLGVSENSGAPDRLSAITLNNQETYLMIPPSIDGSDQSHMDFYAELKKFKELRLPQGY